jgi:hypothetical protein
LSTGKETAFVADERLVALRLRHDEVVRISRLRRGLDFFLRRIEPAKLDVLQNGVVKEKGVLRNEPDVFAKRALRQRTQIVPVDPHDSSRRIVETQDEGKNGALPSSACPD